MIFRESDMAIDAPEHAVLRLDQDTGFLRLNDVSAVDFVIRRSKKAVFAEFKSSAPRDKEEKADYISDVMKKFRDSLLLFLSSLYNRRSDIAMPSELQKVEFPGEQISFILCIRRAKDEHTAILNDELRIEARALRTALGAPVTVQVINENQGLKRGWLTDA